MAPWGQDFEWDEGEDGNVEHNGAHRVTPTEAEDAILDDDRLRVPAQRNPSERRYAIVGATEAGRILLVVYGIRDDTYRVITAFDASETQKRQYRREKRR
jgi:uncharacterized protein